MRNGTKSIKKRQLKSKDQVSNFELLRNKLRRGKNEKNKLATEDILETTRFSVTHPEVLKKAKASGAIVDEQAGRVRLPAELLGEIG